MFKTKIDRVQSRTFPTFAFAVAFVALMAAACSKNKDPQTPAPCSETDEAFCFRLSSNCGILTAADICGVMHSSRCGGDCGAAESCQANQCVCDFPLGGGTCCVPASDADLCVQAGAACGGLTAVDACGQSRTVACVDTCGGGGTCTSTSRACVCTAGGYGGNPVTATDGLGRLDPTTDTLLNDVPFVNDAGTWRSCTQNTTLALETTCVSVGGRQTHLLGATPDASSILVHRASGSCGLTQYWLYDGTFTPESYYGVEITADVTSAGFDLNDGQLLTLTPDGLTIVGRTPAGVLQSVTRSARSPTAFDFAPPTAAWFATINFVGVIRDVAISNDSLFLFFVVQGSPSELWQAVRSGPAEAFGSPQKLAGTATDQVNDGTFEAVTGAGAGGHTVYITKNFATYVFTRDQTTDPLALQNGASPFAVWYAHPIFGCERLLGTMSPGGCAGEGIGTLVYSW